MHYYERYCKKHTCFKYSQIIPFDSPPPSGHPPTHQAESWQAIVTIGDPRGGGGVVVAAFEKVRMIDCRQISRLTLGWTCWSSMSWGDPQPEPLPPSYEEWDVINFNTVVCLLGNFLIKSCFSWSQRQDCYFLYDAENLLVFVCQSSVLLCRETADLGSTMLSQLS